MSRLAGSALHEARMAQDSSALDDAPLMLVAKWVLVGILVTRGSIDKVLGNITFSFFGLPFGAVINLAVIGGSAFVCAMTFPRVRHSVGPWMLGLVAYMALSVLYTPDRGEAMRFVAMSMTNVAILALPFVFVRTEEQVRTYFLILFVAAITPVLMGPIIGGERAESTFPHPNIYGFFLVLFLLTGAVSLSWPGWRDAVIQKRLFLMLALPALYMLYRSGARGAWAGLVGTGLFLAVFLDRRYLLLLLLAPVALSVPEIQSRIADVFSPVEYVGNGVEANSYVWRVMLWESAYPWFLESPIFGYGIDSFAVYSPRFFALEEAGYNAHSVYVQLGFELGVLGLILWILAFIRLAVIAIKARHVAPEPAILLLCLVLFYSIICYSDNILYYLSFNWYYWFVVGLCHKWIRIRQSNAVPRANA